MLDRDLAELYEVEVRVLKQAIQRNSKRFPADFMFELTKEEEKSLFRKSVSELARERNDLRRMVRSRDKEIRKLSVEESSWRIITYEALTELYPRIPDEVREGKLKRILAQGKREGSYLEIVGEISEPYGSFDQADNDKLAV